MRVAMQRAVRSGPRLSDQRVTEITITPRGRRALARIRQVAAQVYGQVTADLSAEEIAVLNELLGRLETNLLKMRDRHDSR